MMGTIPILPRDTISRQIRSYSPAPDTTSKCSLPACSKFFGACPLETKVCKSLLFMKMKGSSTSNEFGAAIITFVEPLISVVIPTYNRKTIVLEAIRSVLEQEPKNFEVIVVDDGSTDGTKEYLESLHLPIRIVRKENGGVSSARNEGIRQAKGRYISFLDSDDLWLPGILKAQLDYLESHPTIPLVYVDQYIELKGKRIDVTRFTMKKLTHEEMSRFDLPGFAQSPPIHISGICVSKSVFEELGLFNEALRIHEDTDMWNRISEKYELGYIERPFAVFRWERDADHLLKPSARKEFMSEGRKYIEIYLNRRKNRELTEREKTAIEASYRRMQKLDILIEEWEKGNITEEEFEAKRQEISIS